MDKKRNLDGFIPKIQDLKRVKPPQAGIRRGGKGFPQPE